jgi:hypothetical protein
MGRQLRRAAALQEGKISQEGRGHRRGLLFSLDFGHRFGHIFGAHFRATEIRPMSNSSMTHAERVRENRARRAVERQGYILRKSRSRDPRAVDYGCYYIVNDRNTAVAGADLGRASMDLADVEAWLKEDA